MSTGTGIGVSGGGMRWDGLFADLEAQAEALDVAERAAEIDERARLEIGRIRLLDRLRPTVGLPVRLRCRGAVTVAGPLRRVGPDWLLVDEGSEREALVVLAAVLGVSGLARLSGVPDSEGVVESRLGLRHALRGIARDRSAVRITDQSGATVDGTIDRLGADYVEVAEHAAGELRRRADVRDVLVLPLAALAVVRRATG
jgi:hypothetical protein